MHIMVRLINDVPVQKSIQFYVQTGILPKAFSLTTNSFHFNALPWTLIVRFSHHRSDPRPCQSLESKLESLSPDILLYKVAQYKVLR